MRNRRESDMKWRPGSRSLKRERADPGRPSTEASGPAHDPEAPSFSVVASLDTRLEERLTMSRRRFLNQGAVAAGALLVPGLARGQSDPPAASIPAAPAAGPRGVTIPEVPAIPRPIAAASYNARITAARERMALAGVDAAIIPPGADMRYLTGLELRRRERIVALVLPREGPTLLLCPEVEEGIGSSPVTIDRVVRWKDDEAPDRMLVEHLKDMKLQEKRIALGLSTHFEEMAEIHAALPKVGFVSAAAITRSLRERKSEEEIALIRAAAILADRSIALSWSDVKEGMTEKDLAAIAAGRAAVEAAGAPLDAVARAQFGRNTTRRHAAPTDRRLVRGDVIIMEVGVRLHGYWGRVSRTGILGQPTGRMKTIQAMILDARVRSLDMAREGLSAAALYEKARSSLGTRGFSKFVPLRIGQGLGLEPEERPYVSPAYHELLAAGNVVTFEPGLETPEEYGLRSGDVLEVSAAGGRFLTGTPEAIVEIP